MRRELQRLEAEAAAPEPPPLAHRPAMGLNPRTLSDAVLKRIAPQDRKRLNLPPPLYEVLARSAAKNERVLQDQIDALLRQRGITFCRPRMDKKTTIRKGWVDFSLAIHGRAVGLEAKLPNQLPTEEQLRVMAGMIRDGWFVRVVHSLEEAIQALKEVEDGPRIV